MAIKRYSKKEPLVFLWILAPYTVFLNLLMFGPFIFSSISVFVKSFLYNGLFLLVIYAMFGMVALIIQKRFSAAGDLFKRIAIMLPCFYLMNGIAITVLFSLHNKYLVLNSEPLQGMLAWTIFYGCIMSTLITFINEAVSNWEAWKVSLTETEKLKNLYRRSNVLGIKGQINPHFLFNCFNTLSGLIQENEEKADSFLNELTKVHRYLLRSDDELLVTLDQEIKFAASYLYLTKERFGDAINSSIVIDEDVLQKTLPPLSMQVILENIIYTNALRKNDPLNITIRNKTGDLLVVDHSIHEKTAIENYGVDDGLYNLINKYKMLNAPEIAVSEKGGKRTLEVPLFDKTGIAV